MRVKIFWAFHLKTYLVFVENKKVVVKLRLFGLKLRFFREQSFVMEVGELLDLLKVQIYKNSGRSSRKLVNFYVNKCISIEKILILKRTRPTRGPRLYQGAKPPGPTLVTALYTRCVSTL